MALGYSTPTGFRRSTGFQRDPQDRGVTTTINTEPIVIIFQELLTIVAAPSTPPHNNVVDLARPSALPLGTCTLTS